MLLFVWYAQDCIEAQRGERENYAHEAAFI